MLVTSLAALVVIWVGVLVFAATRPDTVLIQRITTIKASPETIFPLVSDFRNWRRWSPFEALDPAMKRAYSGALGNKGAVYEWDGKGRAGKGRMEVFDASPPAWVMISVEFLKPFAVHNFNLFALEPRGDSTTVTWIMDGNRPYLLKLMSVFVSTDRLMGKHFETGLANLRVAAEETGNS